MLLESVRVATIRDANSIGSWPTCTHYTQTKDDVIYIQINTPTR